MAKGGILLLAEIGILYLTIHSISALHPRNKNFLRKSAEILRLLFIVRTRFPDKL